MRPWFLGLCVGFTLVTPLAKRVLASAYAPKAIYGTEITVSDESMPIDYDSMPYDSDLSETAEPTIAN